MDPQADTGSLTRKTIIGAAWLLLWRAVTRSLGLVSTLILARLLKPSDFGLVAMATTFSYGVEALSQLGLQEALVRRREEGMDLHHTAFTLQSGRAILTAGIIAAGAPAAAAWFGERRLIPVLLVLSVFTAINGLENVGIAEYRRAMRFDTQFKLMSVPRVASFLTTLTCALVWRSYWALLAGIVVSSITRVAMSYRLHPFRPTLRIRRWRELARFSFWTWATAIASLVWERCDPFVLGPAFGAAKLGLYLLAFEIAMLPVTELVAPAADALFAAFSRAQKDGVSSAHHAPQAAGLVLLGIAPVVLGISAVSGPIVEVMLGAKWHAAWPIVAVLVWACAFSPYSYICSMALVANNHVQRNFIANAAVSAIKLAVLLATVARTTDPVVIGAATAACIAVESSTYLLLLRGTGEIRLRPAIGGIVRVVAATAAAAFVVSKTGMAWQPGLGATVPDLLRGVAVVFLGAGTYAAAVALLWLAMGRPEGAETRLAGLAGERLRALRVRVGRKEESASF